MKSLLIAALAAGLTVPLWAAAPANDNFNSAIVITGLVGTATGNNISATLQGGEPVPANHGRSVWWRWTAPSNVCMNFDTIGSLNTDGQTPLDTGLRIYTGTALTSLTLVAEDLDGGVEETSHVVFNAVSNTTYQIQVTGYIFGGSADEGTIVLNRRPAGSGPANDAFTAATVLAAGGGVIAGTTTNATRDCGEPLLSLNGSPDGGRSVWYRWTAPASGLWTFFTFSNSFDTIMGVYTGNSYATLATVGENDDDPDAPGGCSRVTFQAVAATEYRIRVDGFEQERGSFLLQWGVHPLITSFSPARGGAGDTLIVGGAGFIGVTNVRLSALPLNFSVNSASIVTATVPPDAPSGPLRVATTNGTAVSANTFVFLPQPVVTNVSVAGDSFSFKFPTQPGVIYAVERRDSVTNGVWQVFDYVAGDGLEKTVTQPAAGLTQRQYRVRAQ
jgi:hypothetical protein